MTSYTLINYFRKLLEFFWVQPSDMHKLKQPLGVVPRKQDDDNNNENTQNLLQSRLLDALLFYGKGNGMKVMGNA